jgi:hypothetical protein
MSAGIAKEENERVVGNSHEDYGENDRAGGHSHKD